MTEIYRHRQLGRVVIGAALLAWALIAASLFVEPSGPWQGPRWLWLPTLVLGATVLVFGALEVVVDERALCWRFGWLPWPRWRVPLADIERVEPARSRWREGWGIRWTREGMLYNVSGFDAVRIVRRKGKPLRLGSDDAAMLLACLQSRVGKQANG